LAYVFQTTGWGKIRVKFFEYSNSKEYFLQLGVVKYKEGSMTKPGCDFILGSNTLKELEIGKRSHCGFPPHSTQSTAFIMEVLKGMNVNQVILSTRNNGIKCGVVRLFGSGSKAVG
jgi:hypothetical protein